MVDCIFLNARNWYLNIFAVLISLFYNFLNITIGQPFVCVAIVLYADIRAYIVHLNANTSPSTLESADNKPISLKEKVFYSEIFQSLIVSSLAM